MNKNRQYVPAMSLQEVVADIERFLMPLVAPEADQDPTTLIWPPGGPWSMK